MMTTQKLTLSHIKEDNKKYNEKQRIELNDQYHTYIYPNFDPARIMKMFKSLIQDFTDIKNKKGVKTELSPGDLLYVYTIVEFSDIAEFPKKLTDKLKMFEEIVKSDFASKIYESFPKDSLQRIDKRALNVAKIAQQSKEFVDSLEANEDILRKVEELTQEDS
ncbi:hypothetical protein [Bacillus paralicheniformis]|uniref:hypothetical protein n=2 Tax=Bacillus paralicheniformis TaxID=1648923 RepID=UPI0013811668|nr:hypothetical protein [Bacillus paralicheniformis]TWK86687.1 hypothetical protein CHCC20333_3546 [Bacillus paralicheniformis]